MSRFLSRATMALAVAVCALATAAAGSASARFAPPGTVRVGTIAATPAPVLRHAVATSLALHVTVALRPRDPAALRAYATAVATPGSASYRRYLSPGQFSRRFGATAAAVALVRSALRARGLRPGAVSGGGLSIPVAATTGALQRAFAIGFDRVAVAGGRTAVRADAAPALPAAAAAHVQAIVGLDSSSAPRPLLARLRRPAHLSGAATLARPHVVTGGPQPCASARSAAPRSYAYTIDEIASAYGFSGLYGLGDEGAGETIALYELEPDDPADIAAYQACYGTHAAVSYERVDGGAGAGAGTGEAALDIENTIGLAPAANVLVYQGPNSDSGDPGSGPYDIFAAIVSQDRAQVASVSWGECEPSLGRADASSENTLFQEAAVQGQTIISAAGDSGAQDCDVPGSVPDTRVAVDDPASQPFVTGVGGTSMSAPGPPPAESVWNSGATRLAVSLSAGAGGGGVSSLWAMPVAQSAASSGLGVPKSAASGSACGRASGLCREVPDVAADADPATGYEIYWNGSGSTAGEPSGWQGIGGTSGAAPVWGAALALVDASPACGGTKLGFADPALYRAASSSYAADFHDVTTGDNDFTATNGGQFPAGAGYDLASGLGTPDATALDGDLCADTVRLTGLAARLSAAGADQSVALRARDATGERVTWSARGLPPGLHLAGTTGRITGAPRHAGRWTVTVTARDRAGSSVTGRFTWTVGGPARLSNPRLIMEAPLALTFTAITARNAPPIKTLRVSAPRGLRLRARGGIVVTGTGRGATRLRHAVSAGRGVVTITLHRPTARVTVTVRSPALALTGRGLPAPGEQLTVRVGDTGHGTSRLAQRLGR